MTTRTRGAEPDRPGSRPRPTDSASNGLLTDRTRRIGSAALGCLLIVRSVGRRSLRGLATALVGAWLLVRAIGGGERVRRALRRRTGDRAPDRSGSGETTVTRSVTVGKPATELYENWRDPDQFSRILGHFADVTPVDDERLRWTVHGPGGRDVSWETRVVADEPGEEFRWVTSPDATVPNEGSVRFRPASGDRGTVVTLTLRFDAPAGKFGNETLERLDVVPAAVAGTALGRFKSLAESGEIPTLERNPSARGSGDLL